MISNDYKKSAANRRRPKVAVCSFDLTIVISLGQYLYGIIGLKMITRSFCSAKTKVSKPLSSVRVIELEGLAIAPFVGKLLQDYGATVTRIDRLDRKPHYGTTALGHGKSVISIRFEK